MSTATDMLAAYLVAEASILKGQSVRWQDGRYLTRADLAEIRKGRSEWQRVVNSETAAAAGQSGHSYSVADFSC